jgi:hypothetical protein
MIWINLSFFVAIGSLNPLATSSSHKCGHMPQSLRFPQIVIMSFVGEI